MAAPTGLASPIKTAATIGVASRTTVGMIVTLEILEALGMIEKGHLDPGTDMMTEVVTTLIPATLMIRRMVRPVVMATETDMAAEEAAAAAAEADCR